jgi:serine/threonine protein phosphatase PrpC
MTECNVVQITAFTHQGRVRSGNEDTISVGDWLRNRPMSIPSQWLFELESPLVCVVADGMGGHAAGEIASQHVATRIKEESVRIASANELARVLQDINTEIYELMTADPSRIGMGTTIVGLLLIHGRLIWFNVGDSRLYQHCSGSLRQISADDVPDLASGHIASPKRTSHAITQSLGGAEAIQQLAPHVGMDDLPVPSRWLLCSDGLTDMVDIDAMETCMDASDQEAMLNLFELAMLAGGDDNVSIIIVSIVSEDDVASAWEPDGRTLGKAVG